ncbi:MAG TPA: tripartite tricarboxylate transporter substrate binding protein [Thermodesulfobacteriota bacterium]|nr:tripartite tricarboxylate transporter substrate binding protein [Thermodesulfobacteriota bacterium]
MKRKNVVLALCLFLIGFVFAPPAGAADNFPTKPLELVVPYAAGGSTDVMCRTIVARATPFLNNQPCIVVNKTGGGTVIGSKYVLDGRNDGYTLYSTSTSSMMIAPVVNKTNFSWKDFLGIAQSMLGSDAIYVRSDAPFDTLDKFIDYAKKNPGKIKYATSGAGTSPHLSGEGLAAVKGISIKHIPTKGDAEAVAALLGGHVMAACGNPIAYQPHAEAGKLRCLAQFGSERDKAFLPKVPTYKEQGVNVVIDLWRWIVVPKGVPTERVQFLREAFNKILHDKETLAALEKIQCPVSYIPGDGYEKVMAESEKAIMPLIKAAGL